MKSLHFSVAIIGAGPAGASCAISLAQHGAPGIALIDKHRFPRDKSCGDGIGPGAVQIMKKLGLGDHLSAHIPIKYLSVSGPSGVRAKGLLPLIGGSRPVGYTIPRLTFDNYITQAALAAGVTDLTGNQFEDAAFDNDRWKFTLRNTQSGERTTATADILLGSDGARSKVRRILRVPMNSDRHTGTAVRIYADSPHASFDALHIDFEHDLLPAYGWLFPIDRHRANIGVGIDLQTYRRQHQHLKKLLACYRRSLGSDLAYDEQSYNAFILPYGSELPILAHPRLRAALLGDAGSMVNPLTGEGIFYGMFAGELLGRLLALALKKGRPHLDNALERYEQQFRFRFEQHFSLNWTMKEKVEIPIWCNMVINACRTDQKVLGDLIDLMMGDKRNINLSMLFRIIARNLLPSLPSSLRTSQTTGLDDGEP
jgi:geranylgeranyl reductase family protein